MSAIACLCVVLALLLCSNDVAALSPSRAAAASAAALKAETDAEEHAHALSTVNAFKPGQNKGKKCYIFEVFKN